MKGLNVTAGTIARTVCLFLALLNQALLISGRTVLPIDDETISQMVTLGATLVTAIAAWWKNNSFTEAAKRGDLVMQGLKDVNKEDT